MRKLAIIPGLIFGLIFAGGGFFFLSETAIPTWQNWQSMHNWQPGFAQLISASGAENYTEAHYRYEFGGLDFEGTRVYVADFKDNIGSYHADMLQLLRRYQQSGQPLPIWINPHFPQESVIDREMRWGLFLLMSAFCSVFILIGLAVIYGSVSSKKLQQQTSGESKITDWQSRKGWGSAKIASDAVKGAWFYWLFAIFWNAISTPIIFILPDELENENYIALVALLFPLVGIFLLYKAITTALEYRHFGKVFLEMDPYPGAIGGHVGGRIQVTRLDHHKVSEASELSVQLECIYSYMSGSGKNRSRRESIKWVEQGNPRVINSAQGVTLSFRFDVPANLPDADVEQSSAYHFWRLSVKADITGVDLNRNYNIPVFNTGETSRFIAHDISAQSAALKAQQSEAAKIAIASGNFDIEGLSRAMQLHTQGNEIHIKFPMLRNKLLTLFAAVFAGGFGFASFSMAGIASQGGLFGIFITLFGIPFFLVALLAVIATIYLPLNNLRVTIRSGEVWVVRRLLFIPIYRRHLSRNDISHLSIKRSGSTGQGINKIEHYKLKVQDKQGRSVTLAEDLDGEDVASHFADYIAQRLNVAVR